MFTVKFVYNNSVNNYFPKAVLKIINTVSDPKFK